VLIGPDLTGSPRALASLVGVAPATVVNAPHYAARLREADVEIDELSAKDAASVDWMSTLRGNMQRRWAA
jgi:hypothetical protein